MEDEKDDEVKDDIKDDVTDDTEPDEKDDAPASDESVDDEPVDEPADEPVAESDEGIKGATQEDLIALESRISGMIEEKFNQLSANITATQRLPQEADKTAEDKLNAAKNIYSN